MLIKYKDSWPVSRLDGLKSLEQEPRICIFKTTQQSLIIQKIWKTQIEKNETQRDGMPKVAQYCWLVSFSLCPQKVRERENNWHMSSASSCPGPALGTCWHLGKLRNQPRTGVLAPNCFQGRTRSGINLPPPNQGLGGCLTALGNSRALGRHTDRWAEPGCWTRFYRNWEHSLHLTRQLLIIHTSGRWEPLNGGTEDTRQTHFLKDSRILYVSIREIAHI